MRRTYFARRPHPGLDSRAEMSSDSKRELRAFVERWQTASARLDDLRREDLRDVDVAERIEALNGAFEAALARLPPRKTCGLVEQQAIFARMRNAGPVPPGG